MEDVAAIRERLAKERRQRLHLDVSIDPRGNFILGDGKWQVTKVRHIDKNNSTGELHDLHRGALYVWTRSGSELRFLQIPKLATTVPIYIREAVLKLGKPKRQGASVHP